MILFVCSLGANRSRTAEILCLLANQDARSCGIDSLSMVPINDELLFRASKVYCMEARHLEAVKNMKEYEPTKTHVLDIPDIFSRLDAKLVRLLIEKVGLEDAALSEKLKEGSKLLSKIHRTSKASKEPKGTPGF